MKPTKIRNLFLIALLLFGCGWAATALADQSGRIIPVPSSVTACLALLTVGIGAWALLARPRLRKLPGALPLPPLLAARTAALALAGSRTGAVFGGFFLGAAARLALLLDSPVARDRIVSALALVASSLALVLVCLALESLCRIPPDESDPSLRP